MFSTEPENGKGCPDPSDQGNIQNRYAMSYKQSKASIGIVEYVVMPRRLFLFDWDRNGLHSFVPLRKRERYFMILK